MVLTGGEVAEKQFERLQAGRLQVEYPVRLIREITAHVVERFLSIPKGGVEVGGALFGVREADRVRIEAHRPIRCEYLTGPSFLLSAADEAELAALLETSRGDSGLAGLQLVGWYHSHTRSDIELTDADAALHERYFQGEGSLALVFRPHKFDPTRIGVFVEGPDAEDWRKTPAAEIVVDLLNRNGQLPAPRDARAEIVAPVAIVPAPAAERPLVRRAPRLRRLAVGGAAVFLLLVSAYGVLNLRNDQPQPASSFADIVRLTAEGDTVRIDWDRSSALVRSADGGVLQIMDGEAPPQAVMLDRDTLRAGSFTYLRNSRSVRVRLTIQPPGAPPVEGIAHVLLAERTLPAREPEPRQTLPQPPAPSATDLLATRARISETAEPVQPLPARRFNPPRSTGVPVAASQPVLLEGPASLNTGSAVPSSGSIPLPLASVVPKAAAPPPPQRRAPSSGRVIWTGDLRRGEILTVDARGASSGSLSGEWPAGPVRIRAHGAELSNGALIVYTENTNRGSTPETPGPQNGWNVTVYRYDPERAAAVQIVEAPARANNWKKLSLRAQGKRVSVVVLDWTSAPADQP